MKNTHRFTPLQVGPRTLKNRVVVPPMASETASTFGFVTPKTLNHYISLAGSGAGLVLVEYTYVHPTGRSEENQLGISEDEQVPGLRLISEAIKQEGALAGIQLTHAGGKTHRHLSSGVLLGPGNIPVPVKDQLLEAPTPMTLKEIDDLKMWFITASERAVKAGFDLIELHAAHGYGLNQWLSPITNNRPDQFGGSLENNLRLLKEIVIEIKAQFPNTLLSVRMPGQDFLEGGLTQEECVSIAQTLESCGVEIINVSSGICGWRRPRSRDGEGYLVPEAAFIQRRLKAPVIGVGGIESGAFIDEQLQKNSLALAAVGRAILKNPLQWGRENLGRNESL